MFYSRLHCIHTIINKKIIPPSGRQRYTHMANINRQISRNLCLLYAVFRLHDEDHWQLGRFLFLKRQDIWRTIISKSQVGSLKVLYVRHLLKVIVTLSQHMDGNLNWNTKFHTIPPKKNMPKSFGHPAVLKLQQIQCNNIIQQLCLFFDGVCCGSTSFTSRKKMLRFNFAFCLKSIEGEDIAIFWIWLGWIDTNLTNSTFTEIDERYPNIYTVLTLYLRPVSTHAETLWYTNSLTKLIIGLHWSIGLFSLLYIV